MSLCLALLNREYIAMSADSRIMKKIDGEYYMFDVEAEKIFLFEDKIIFMSGIKSIGEYVINKFKEEKYKTIKKLRELSIESDYKHSIFTFDESQIRLRLDIATFENRKAVLYTINSENDFEIERTECPEEQEMFLTSGVKTEEARSLWKQKVVEWNNVGNFDLFRTYKCIYDELSSEECGGTMTFIFMDREGNAFKLNEKINDIKKHLRKLKLNINYAICDANSATIDFSKFTTKVGELYVHNVPIIDMIISMNSNNQGQLSGNVLIANSVTANQIDVSTLKVCKGKITTNCNVTLMELF